MIEMLAENLFAAAALSFALVVLFIEWRRSKARRLEAERRRADQRRLRWS